MAKTSVENLLDDHLQGLILPAESSDMNDISFWMIGLLLLTVIFFVWKLNKHRKKPRQIALRKLKDLSSQQDDFAMQLTSILQQGLEIPRLEKYKPSNKKQWSAFILELEAACYSSNKPSRSDLENLLEQSDFWLRQI